jgi:hypothetical protein
MAAARPMPDDVPVMSTTRSVDVGIGCLHWSTSGGAAGPVAIMLTGGAGRGNRGVIGRQSLGPAAETEARFDGSIP